MSDAKHTQEPWGFKAHEERPTTIVITGHDPEDPGAPWNIAEMVPGASYDNPDQSEMLNARRIVACVNACAGISTEALEAGAIKDLAAAAHQGLSVIRHLNYLSGRSVEEVQIVSAIAKAEGR